MRVFEGDEWKHTKAPETGAMSRAAAQVHADELRMAGRIIITPFGMRGNVWHGNTRGQEDLCDGSVHPAPMPKWLARDLILSWSNAGDTVIDPMAGSGTTGVQAIQLGRKAILIELNPAYIPIINQQCDVTPGLALA